MKWKALMVTLTALLFAGCVTNVEMPVVSSTHPAHPDGKAVPMMETWHSLNVAENPVIKRTLPISPEGQAASEGAAMTLEMGPDHMHQRPPSSTADENLSEHEDHMTAPGTVEKNMHAHQPSPPVSQGPGATTMYRCSIHPEITADKQGQCVLCGLPLQPTRQTMMRMGNELEDSTAGILGAIASWPYVCPMHPKARAEGPGSCPICQMALVKDGGADQ